MTLAALVLAASGAARAFTLLPPNLAQLTAGAERIVVTRIERAESGQDTHGHRDVDQLRLRCTR